MKFRRRKRHALARLVGSSSRTVIEIAALLAVSWWGWRTFPELVRYVRMTRM